MKKFIAIMMLMLLVGVSMTTALAEDNTATTEDSNEIETNETEIEEEEVDTEPDVSEETEDETEAIHHPYGAVVRFLQLRTSIERNILHAERVIEVLNESENKTTLESILEEFKLIRDEIVALPTEEGNTTELAETFVDLKKDAIDLTHQFKTIATAELSEEQKTQLRAEFKVEKAAVKELKNQVKMQIHEFNARRVKSHFQNMGIGNDTLIQGIRNGQIKKTQIKDKVKNQMQKISPEQKGQALAKGKEAITKGKVQASAVIEKAREKFTERNTERLQERANALGEKGFANKTGVMEKIQQRIQTKIDNLPKLPAARGRSSQ